MNGDKYIEEWALGQEWDRDENGVVDDPSYNLAIMFATKHNLVDIERLLYDLETVADYPTDVWDSIKERQVGIEFHMKNPKVSSPPTGGKYDLYGEDYSRAYTESKDLVKWLEYLRQDKGNETYP
jgi:hypothetical protein